MGCGFTYTGQKSGPVFSAAVCRIQGSKCYITSLRTISAEREGGSLKMKGPLYSSLLIAYLPTESSKLNWQLVTIYRGRCSLADHTFCREKEGFG